MFIDSSPQAGDIFMTTKFMTTKLLVSISLKSFFLKLCLICSFGTYSSLSSFFLTLCVGFYAVNEKQSLPVLKEWLHFGDESFCSTLPSIWLLLKPLSLSKWPIIFLTASYTWECVRPVSVSKGRILVAGFMLTGSQSFWHHLLKVCKYM